MHMIMFFLCFTQYLEHLKILEYPLGVNMKGVGMQMAEDHFGELMKSSYNVPQSKTSCPTPDTAVKYIMHCSCISGQLLLSFGKI